MTLFDERVVRQIDEHNLGTKFLRHAQREVLWRISRHRIPDREPRGDIRRGASNAVEFQHIVVIAIGRVDRDGRLRFAIGHERQ